MYAQSMLFAAAAFASLASAALHAFGGGAVMARPFYRAATARGVATHAFRYCWHFVTLMLSATAGGYAFLAFRPDAVAFGAYLTVTAIGLSALGFIVSRIERAPPSKSPPAILGAIIGALGLAALLAG